MLQATSPLPVGLQQRRLPEDDQLFDHRIPRRHSHRRNHHRAHRLLGPAQGAQAPSGRRIHQPAPADLAACRAGLQLHQAVRFELVAVLFPAERARIVRLLVARVTASVEGLPIELRHEGLGTIARDLLAGNASGAAA